MRWKRCLLSLIWRMVGLEVARQFLRVINKIIIICVWCLFEDCCWDLSCRRFVGLSLNWFSDIRRGGWNLVWSWLYGSLWNFLYLYFLHRASTIRRCMLCFYGGSILVSFSSHRYLLTFCPVPTLTSGCSGRRTRRPLRQTPKGRKPPVCGVADLNSKSL